MSEGFGEKIQRVARRAESGEMAGIQRASEYEAAAQPASEEFSEFPQIARMSLQQIQERLQAIAEDEKRITDWGDITREDRELLTKKDSERKALQRAIASRTTHGDGVRRAA